MKSGHTFSPEDKLQIAIVALIKALAEDEGAKEGVFRNFCKLAIRCSANPEEFRCRLVRAGLPKSRASEIKAVLMAETVARGFAQGESTWQKALENARSDLRQQDKAHQLAARIAAQMYLMGIFALKINGGVFELESRDPFGRNVGS